LRLSIQVEVPTILQSRELVEAGLPMNMGQPYTIEGVGVLTLQGAEESRALDVPTILEIALDVTGGAAGSVVAAWLLSRLRNAGARRLRINRREIQLEEGAIRKVIEETIEFEEH